MKIPGRILIVDDEENILYAFRQVLRKEGQKCIVARNGEEALAMVAREKPAVVFMDITMPKMDGLGALKIMKNRHPAVPVIIITGHGTMHTAIKAMQLGAFEYLTKPLDLEKIREVTHRALNSVIQASMTAQIEYPAEDQGTLRHEIVGNSVRIQAVYKLIGSVSTTPNHTSVLITGESGTGKELVARAIHAHGVNAGEPFVAINCTVLPEPLLESELFGHERGAFTGASERKLGKFEMAGSGTIFLDEIGNLSPKLQQKLLRALQEREFERVGGNVTQHIDARFIAATNIDIASEVRKGTFREDLYYRLNVVSVALPPLRDRREDIPMLAGYFLTKYSQQFHKSLNGLSSEAVDVLSSLPFPGNVRELENVIERAVMTATGNVILPHDIGNVPAENVPGSPNLPISSPLFKDAREQVLRLFEHQFLTEALRTHHGNVTAAAKSAGMTRQNFQRLMNKHHLKAQTFREPR